MFPNSTSDWIAFCGVVIPLSIVAFSAAAHVWNTFRAHNDRDFKRLFELTDTIGRKDGSIVSKVAAINELRKFPKYKDVIVRICDGVEVDGVGKAVDLLYTELKLTKEYFSER